MVDSKRGAQAKATKRDEYMPPAAGRAGIIHADPGKPDGDRTVVTAIRFEHNGTTILYSGGSMKEVQAYIDKYHPGEKAVEL